MGAGGYKAIFESGQGRLTIDQNLHEMRDLRMSIPGRRNGKYKGHGLRKIGILKK